MKKGMILYVTRGKEEVPIQGVADLIETSRSLGISAVSVAVSEEDVIYGWFHLITRGMHQVLLMRVVYDSVLNSFESRGVPLRLCG
ncbi:MAG: hypothetical protein AB9866_31080 [Syntrophobacteraceae bacterium]